MSKALIKITYRQVIDAASVANIEKGIFNASYDEFLLKCQAYNPEGKHKTFTEMKAADGRANSLHYKAGFAIGPYINLLQNKIPHLQDTLEKQLSFETHKFEMIESDITNKAAHKVAVHYITQTLTLFEIIGEYLLLAEGDTLTINPGEPVETFMLKMQPGISISSYM